MKKPFDCIAKGLQSCNWLAGDVLNWNSFSFDIDVRKYIEENYPTTDYSKVFSDEYIQAKFVEEGLSKKELARQNGCSMDNVLRHVNNKSYTGSYRNICFGYPPYGWDKDSNKKMIKNPEEQKIIQDLVSLRINEKYSYGDLAKWLNDRNIKTKKNAKKWSRTAVLKILKRNFSGD